MNIPRKERTKPATIEVNSFQTIHTPVKSNIPGATKIKKNITPVLCEFIIVINIYETNF